MVLKHCLSVPGCRETFSSASWALLQVCPNTFRDVFRELFWKFYINTNGRISSDSSLELIVKQEFESVRDMLIKLKYPNFSSESKFRLVIDEAQLLADMKSNSFESSSNSGIRRPMLSPVLHGFRTPGNKDKLTVIYCGTGLSVKPLDLVRGSGDDVKGGVPTKDFKYIEFPGWDDVNSVQAYVNRIKNALSNKKLKRKVDGLIPQEAVEELHERLTGRFRPIVTAIEIILKEDEEWDSAIDEVEGILTSWWEREKEGNLCGELDRLEAKIAEYLNYFTGRLTIKEAFGLFLSHYYRLGDPSLVLENDTVWLVEIGFGHIKFFNGVARTVLDEPFVLKATENYFQVKDPLLISQAKQGMLQSNNPTVHGIMWETMMPSIFVKTFKVRKTRKLSSWPLPTKVPFPRELNGNVTIVGYEQGRTLTVSHKHLTIQQFMKAHVENGSKQDDPYIPPFYFPAPHVTGPDIIFFVKIKNKIYPCFVQLKLRQKFEKDDAMTALETVSSVTVQKKMKTEHDKQQKSTTSASSDQQQPQLKDYCPDEKYISMVIVYPAKARDDNFCGVQIDSDPGHDGLKCVSIKIDGSNFSDIFPEDHAKFLDILKKCSENQLPQQSQLNKILHWAFGTKGAKASNKQDTNKPHIRTTDLLSRFTGRGLSSDG
ncbi:hypothetical protein BDF22DRAFT_227367 [Syncephalis plumigaleata]|nr:hypothetical protein BDF22DRAFT_227367 [Syncephalis plumigaleata]